MSDEPREIHPLTFFKSPGDARAPGDTTDYRPKVDPEDDQGEAKAATTPPRAQP